MMLTVQSVQADVVGSYRPYDDVSGGDMADVDWQVWLNDCFSCVHLWLMVC